MVMLLIALSIAQKTARAHRTGRLGRRRPHFERGHGLHLQEVRIEARVWCHTKASEHDRAYLQLHPEQSPQHGLQEALGVELCDQEQDQSKLQESIDANVGQQEAVIGFGKMHGRKEEQR